MDIKHKLYKHSDRAHKMQRLADAEGWAWHNARSGLEQRDKPGTSSYQQETMENSEMM